MTADQGGPITVVQTPRGRYKGKNLWSSRELERCGVAWRGLVWFGLVWFGLVCSALLSLTD
jgi:hypothetical protein